MKERIHLRFLNICIDKRAHLSIEWFFDLYSWLVTYLKSNIDECSMFPVPVENNGNHDIIDSIPEDPPVYYRDNDDKSSEEIDCWQNDLPIAVKKLSNYSYISDKLWILIEKSKKQDEISDLLIKANVYPITAHNLLVDLTSNFKNKSEKFSIEDILCITKFLVKSKKKLSSDVNLDKLPVILNDSTVFRRDDTSKLFVVPESFNSKSGWQNIWKKDSERSFFYILHDDYADFSITEFQLLGICEYPPFEEISLNKDNFWELQDYIGNSDRCLVMSNNFCKFLAYILSYLRLYHKIMLDYLQYSIIYLNQFYHPPL